MTTISNAYLIKVIRIDYHVTCLFLISVAFSGFQLWIDILLVFPFIVVFIDPRYYKINYYSNSQYDQHTNENKCFLFYIIHFIDILNLLFFIFIFLIQGIPKHLLCLFVFSRLLFNIFG